MRRVLAAVVLGAIAATPLWSGETYDLMFRSGTLAAADGRSAYDALTYDGSAKAGGHISDFLITADPGTDGSTALTRTEAGQVHRVGSFPTSVGNPVIMYFMEETLRDVAKATGGSPFYLRNRIKEALLGPAEITPARARVGETEVAAQQVTIRPFADIPEHDRMGPYGDLALSVTVAESIPGWYGRLEASTPDNGASGYAYALTLADVAEATP